MSLKPGDKVYLIVHAYHHFVGEVVAVLGVRRVSLRNVVKVHSCERSWTKFFAEGFRKDTKYDVFSDAPDVSYIACFEWTHPIPSA